MAPLWSLTFPEKVAQSGASEIWTPPPCAPSSLCLRGSCLGQGTRAPAPGVLPLPCSRLYASVSPNVRGSLGCPAPLLAGPAPWPPRPSSLAAIPPAGDIPWLAADCPAPAPFRCGQSGRRPGWETAPPPGPHSPAPHQAGRQWGALVGDKLWPG